MKIKSLALLFSGQGSQKVGMGKDLYNNFAVAKDVFERVDETLHYKLSDLIFFGNEDDLSLTNHAQPAIMCVAMAYFEVMKQIGLIDLANVKFMAGHSLGEYSALCAAGALSLEDTAKLLKLRGEYMMQACLEQKGVMSAIIGLDFAQVNQIAALNNCYVGNSNAPTQIVISGGEKEVAAANAEALQRGAKRAITLTVSGAFHSPLMQSAADKMEQALQEAKITLPEVKVISNMTAQPYDSINEIKELLKEQITHTVKWQESINYIAENNAESFVEVGFSNILAGLVKKIRPEVEIKTASEIIKNQEEL